MRYKMVLFLLLVSGNALSTQWPYGEAYLLKTMKVAYDNLNSKTGFCNGLRDRKIESIKSDWLYSLPIQKRKAVILIVEKMTMDRCVNDATNEYNSALLNYTSISNDKSYLDDWLVLKNIDNTSHKKQHNIVELILDLPYDKVIELSKRPEFYTPFNSIAAARVVEPE